MRGLRVPAWMCQGTGEEPGKEDTPKEETFLDVDSWAQCEEHCDCHLVKDGELSCKWNL